MVNQKTVKATLTAIKQFLSNRRDINETIKRELSNRRGTNQMIKSELHALEKQLTAANKRKLPLKNLPLKNLPPKKRKTVRRRTNSASSPKKTPASSPNKTPEAWSQGVRALELAAPRTAANKTNHPPRFPHLAAHRDSSPPSPRFPHLAAHRESSPSPRFRHLASRPK